MYFSHLIFVNRWIHNIEEEHKSNDAKKLCACDLLLADYRLLSGNENIHEEVKKEGEAKTVEKNPESFGAKSLWREWRVTLLDIQIFRLIQQRF